MKDLIIGCSTNYDWSKLKYWINSINRSGFEGEKVLVLMNCDKETVMKVHDAGFSVVGFLQDKDQNLVYQSELPVHVERFLHIYDYIRKMGPFRYVITTDVKDVIFQKNPIPFIEANLGLKNLMFASESLLYRHEPWGNQNLLDTYGEYLYKLYRDNEIFNVGVLAGTGDAMRDLAINIFSSCLNKPVKICDQSTFNFMVSMEPYKSTSVYLRSESGWAAQLGTTADPTKLNQFKPFLLEETPKLSGDVVTTSTGQPFTIVHQYDRVPGWRETLEAKYDD